MFNYIHETIINDAEAIQKITGGFVVKRGGQYILENIYGKKVYVAKGVKGSAAEASFATYKAPASGNLVRLTIFLSTPSTELAEFAMPNWHEFGKPFVIETGGKDAATVKTALELAQNSDNVLFKVDASSGLKLTTTDSTLDFAEVTLTEFTPATGEKDEVVVSETKATIKHAVTEFGTAKWIRENLRFPSGPNMRYAPLYADEAPVAGTTYNQYSFQYKVERVAPGGLSGVNQIVSGLSTQVLFVPAGGDVETALKEALGETITLESIDVSKVTAASDTAAITTEAAKTQASSSDQKVNTGK